MVFILFEDYAMKDTRRFSTFFYMFSIVFLLSLNFTILRSVRNTLAVVDLGKGAHAIPLFELCGAMPAAFLLTWLLTHFLKRFSIYRVFMITLGMFVGFFLLFVFGLYPWVKTLDSALIKQGFSMLFYALAELWKPALIMILFWGLINLYTSKEQAKTLYAPLMLGASLGSMTAGPLVAAATSEFCFKLIPMSDAKWNHALILMMSSLCFISLIAAFLYSRLWHLFSKEAIHATNLEKPSFSLRENISLCLKSPTLKLLSWTVIADYIAYSLGEVIFLDLLKLRYPNPCDYCHYMGQLSLWSGALTVFFAFFIAPFFFKKCSWVTAALATPLCLLATEGAFFIFLRWQGIGYSWFGLTESEWLGILIFLGSTQFCLCRAAKYTLLDTSKELAFVAMQREEALRGKLIVDGICARFGRGSGSFLSLSFIALFGGVLASSLAAGFVALGVAISWILSTSQLGKLIEKKNVVKNTN